MAPGDAVAYSELWLCEMRHQHLLSTCAGSVVVISDLTASNYAAVLVAAVL
jgi:hypothetical protein